MFFIIGVQYNGNTLLLPTLCLSVSIVSLIDPEYSFKLISYYCLMEGPISFLQ